MEILSKFEVDYDRLLWVECGREMPQMNSGRIVDRRLVRICKKLADYSK